MVYNAFEGTEILSSRMGQTLLLQENLPAQILSKFTTMSLVKNSSKSREITRGVPLIT